MTRPRRLWVFAIALAATSYPADRILHTWLGNLPLTSNVAAALLSSVFLALLVETLVTHNERRVREAQQRHLEREFVSRLEPAWAELRELLELRSPCTDREFHEYSTALAIVRDEWESRLAAVADDAETVSAGPEPTNNGFGASAEMVGAWGGRLFPAGSDTRQRQLERRIAQSLLPLAVNLDDQSDLDLRITFTDALERLRDELDAFQEYAPEADPWSDLQAGSTSGYTRTSVNQEEATLGSLESITTMLKAFRDFHQAGEGYVDYWKSRFRRASDVNGRAKSLVRSTLND